MLCFLLLCSKAIQLYIARLFHIIFLSGLSQDPAYSSLCYTLFIPVYPSYIY